MPRARLHARPNKITSPRRVHHQRDLSRPVPRDDETDGRFRVKGGTRGGRSQTTNEKNIRHLGGTFHWKLWKLRKVQMHPHPSPFHRHRRVSLVVSARGVRLLRPLRPRRLLRRACVRRASASGRSRARPAREHGRACGPPDARSYCRRSQCRSALQGSFSRRTNATRESAHVSESKTLVIAQPILRFGRRAVRACVR